MRAVPWTFRQTLVGAGLTVVPLAALLASTRIASSGALPAAPLPPALDRANAVVTAVSTALVECVFLIAPLYYAFKQTPGEDAIQSGLEETAAPTGLRALGLRGFRVVPALGLMFIGYAAIYLFGVLYNLLRIPTNIDALLREAMRAPQTTIATLAVAVIVAPICEEIFFRGFMVPGLNKGMSAWTAVAVSALVFGVAHADPGSFLPLVVIGLVLGVLRLRTGSIWPGIAVHAFNNLIAAIVVVSALHH